MKKELLSPAGSMEALKMAVYHGADAVYLGGKKFGARAFAANFSDEEMKQAIFFCHLYGVRIYVTVNTMIYESEMSEVLDYVQFLYENHVDAIIMADIGLMKLCHEKFPDLEIHASTQVHTHNKKQLVLLKDLGVKRIVLARELSLEEIKEFPDDLEIEVFIHGALCISYSGQCLFSSLLMNRSGNRGECAQICRLPFQLLHHGELVKTNGDYLLSTKDLNTSSHFAELMNTNIKSFKIEGRMKSPAYVGFMTSIYRNLIDHYQNQSCPVVSNDDTKKMETLFGRGFTLGKLFHQTNQNFMNQLTSNHQGSYLGEVELIDKKKIGIRLHDDLHQEDGIRFVSENKGMMVNFLYNSQNLLVSSASKGELIFVDNKIGVTSKGQVMKTLDRYLEKQILEQSEKKIPIFMKLQIADSLIHLEISDGLYQVMLEDTCVSPSKNCPLTQESVQKQFGKLGNTPFVLKEFHLDLGENLYINVRDMNEIRRLGIEQLMENRVSRGEAIIHSCKAECYEYDTTLEITATARCERQVEALLRLGISKIYVSDFSLYQKYASKGIVYRMNRVNHTGVYPNVSKALLGESGGLTTTVSEKYLDYFFNIANHASADFWMSRGVKQMCITPEITDNELEKLLAHYKNGNPFEFIVYGRLEVMVLNHCIVQMNLKEEGCVSCQRNDSFALKDRNGKIYPFEMDENHRTHLFHCDIVNLISHIPFYYQMGIRKFRLEFYDESPEKITEIVNQVKKSLCV